MEKGFSPGLVAIAGSMQQLSISLSVENERLVKAIESLTAALENASKNESRARRENASMVHKVVAE